MKNHVLHLTTISVVLIAYPLGFQATDAKDQVPRAAVLLPEGGDGTPPAARGDHAKAAADKAAAERVAAQHPGRVPRAENIEDKCYWERQERYKDVEPISPACFGGHAEPIAPLLLIAPVADTQMPHYHPIVDRSTR